MKKLFGIICIVIGCFLLLLIGDTELHTEITNANYSVTSVRETILWQSILGGILLLLGFYFLAALKN